MITIILHLSRNENMRPIGRGALWGGWASPGEDDQLNIFDAQTYGDDIPNLIRVFVKYITIK